jgi:ectoine hydroxylase-related dioxygenase (phytanoyl-CoA dioxygenase family)
MAPEFRPFRDSAALVGDGDALRRRMDADGYLFIRGLIPPADIAALRARTLPMMAAAGWLKAGTDPDESIAEPSRACVDPEPAYLEVYRPMYRLEALHAIAHHPAVMGVLESMLGGPVLPHPRLILRNVFPQRPDYTTPAHQDYPHIQGTPETYSVWVPLGDCPVERGGLMVAEGTHRDGVLPFRVSPGAGGMEVTDPFAGRWVGGDFAMGDAILFHSMVVHRALPNVSDRLRQSVDNRYQRIDAPLVEASLRPYANLFTWEEIYAGWGSDRLQYYWKDRLTNLVPFDQRWYEERDRIAFDMAEQGDGAARAALLRIVQRDRDAAKRERAAALLARLEAA